MSAERREKDNRFLVDTENVDLIIDNIKKMVDAEYFKERMKHAKVTRVIYRMPCLKENEYRWLRILIGDIDCHGNSGVTITYKVKNTHVGFEQKIPFLKVDDFDRATEFFESLGFARTSLQENYRTKIYVTFEKIKYMIRFDIWPSLEEVTFVTVEEVTPTDPRTRAAFIDFLKLRDYDVSSGSIVDVDTAYKERLGFKASDIPQLCFELDLKKQCEESQEQNKSDEKDNLFYMWLSNGWGDVQRLFQAFRKSRYTMDEAIDLLTKK